MASIRARYENGHFVPLEPVDDLQDGEEVEVTVTRLPSRDAIQEMLDRTRGLWADIEGIEEFLDEMRRRWDEEWQQRLNSL
jgi:predicted DNA-binding antitoxin AbrB/MazE fold protein